MSFKEDLATSPEYSANARKTRKILEAHYQHQLPLILQIEQKQKEVKELAEKKLAEERQRIATAQALAARQLAEAQAAAAVQQRARNRTAMQGRIGFNHAMAQGAYMQQSVNNLCASIQQSNAHACLPQIPSTISLPNYNHYYTSEQFSWYKLTNPYLSYSPGSSLLSYANNTTGGPGLFNNANLGRSTNVPTRNNGDSIPEITINCSSHPDTPSQYQCPKKLF